MSRLCWRWICLMKSVIKEKNVFLLSAQSLSNRWSSSHPESLTIREDWKPYSSPGHQFSPSVRDLDNSGRFVYSPEPVNLDRISNMHVQVWYQSQRGHICLSWQGLHDSRTWRTSWATISLHDIAALVSEGLLEFRNCDAWATEIVFFHGPHRQAGWRISTAATKTMKEYYLDVEHYWYGTGHKKPL